LDEAVASDRERVRRGEMTPEEADRRRQYREQKHWSDLIDRERARDDYERYRQSAGYRERGRESDRSGRAAGRGRSAPVYEPREDPNSRRARELAAERDRRMEVEMRRQGFTPVDWAAHFSGPQP
jgi:hypothetical protein